MWKGLMLVHRLLLEANMPTQPAKSPTKLLLDNDFEIFKEKVKNCVHTPAL